MVVVVAVVADVNMKLIQFAMRWSVPQRIIVGVVIAGKSDWYDIVLIQFVLSRRVSLRGRNALVTSHYKKLRR